VILVVIVAVWSAPNWMIGAQVGGKCPGGGEAGVEDDDGGVAIGHPPEFAVAVHPGVGAFDGPALGAWLRPGMPVQAIWAAAR
jgi:hypothetical protein